MKAFQSIVNKINKDNLDHVASKISAERLKKILLTLTVDEVVEIMIQPQTWQERVRKELEKLIPDNQLTALLSAISDERTVEVLLKTIHEKDIISALEALQQNGPMMRKVLLLLEAKKQQSVIEIWRCTLDKTYNDKKYGKHFQDNDPQLLQIFVPLEAALRAMSADQLTPILISVGEGEKFSSRISIKLIIRLML